MLEIELKPFQDSKKKVGLNNSYTSLGQIAPELFLFWTKLFANSQGIYSERSEKAQ